MNRALFLLFATALYAQSSLGDDFEQLKVGFIAPLTGPAAAYGVAARNGFEMGLAELPEGRISVTYEDDQYSAAKTVSAFKKLVEVDGVDLIISLASTPSNAIAPLAERMKIPLLAWANDPKVARGREYVVLTEQSATQEGKLIAEEVSRRGYRRVSFITATGDYQQAVADGVRARVPRDNLVFLKEVSSDDRDFRSILANAKRREVEAIGMCLHPGQFGILAKQAWQIGLAVPMFGCNAMQDRDDFRASGGALENAWYVTIPVDNKFNKMYLEKFGSDTVIAGAALHYEIAQLLSQVSVSGKRSGGIIEKLLRLKVAGGAVGDFEIVREDGVSFFNIRMVIKAH